MSPIDAFFADPVIGLGNLIATSYLIPLSIFVGLYATHSPWWDNELGIALLLQKISFVLIFVLLTIGFFFHDWEGRAATRLFFYAIVGFTLWLDVVNLRRYQRRYKFNAITAKKPRFVDILRRYVRPEK